MILINLVLSIAFLLLFECGHYVLLPLILDFYYVFVPGFTVGDVIN